MVGVVGGLLVTVPVVRGPYVQAERTATQITTERAAITRVLLFDLLLAHAELSTITASFIAIA